MATLPNNMASFSPENESAEGAPDAEAPEGSGGFEIEISVDGQGGITVGSESASDEASESAGSEEAQGQPAANIKEALTIALGIYKEKSRGMTQTADGSEREQMLAGFQQG
jgi:hypothetical protein